MVNRKFLKRLKRKATNLVAMANEAIATAALCDAEFPADASDVAEMRKLRLRASAALSVMDRIEASGVWEEIPQV